MPFPLAAATSHLGVFAAVMIVAFVFGVYGQIIRSKTLIVAAIIVIAIVSLYFVAAGEVQTF